MKENNIPKKIRRVLMSILIIITLLVLSLFTFLFFIQDKMLFFPQPLIAENRTELKPLEYSLKNGNILLKGWFLNRPVSRQKPLLVYYGGNGEELSWSTADFYKNLDNAVLFVNYRGYGDSQGSPSQKALFKDALFILDAFLKERDISPENTVLIGRSLGSGVAVYTASKRPVRGVILITPFDSITNVAKTVFPFLPVSLLLRHPFDSLSRAPKLKIPALFLISEMDEVIPRKNTDRLYDAWGGKHEQVLFPGAGHNNIQNMPKFFSSMKDWLAQLPEKH